MKVLLIQPPHYYDGKSRLPDFAPLALGYIARILLNLGHDVEVLDIWAHQWTNEDVLQKLQYYVSNQVFKVFLVPNFRKFYIRGASSPKMGNGKGVSNDYGEIAERKRRTKRGKQAST